MAATCSPRGGPRHTKSLVSLAGVLACVLAVLRGAAGGLVHHHPPPFGVAGPLTVVRHAPPAVPPYSTQVNVFRWLAAFPPPVLHRALVLAHGPPPLHPPPVLHHAPLPPPQAVVPTAPVLPPPPPPIVKTPVPQLPLGFPLGTSLNFPLGPGYNFPLGPGYSFPPEALPFAPGLLPTSSFLPARGLLPAPFPGAFPAAFPTAFPGPFPGPLPPTPTLKSPLPPFGFAPNGLLPNGLLPNGLLPSSAFLPGAFGPTLPPGNFDFGVATRGPSPPPVGLPAPAPSPTPTPAGLVFQDGFHSHLRQYVPAGNGITRATAGNLAL